MLMYLLNGDEKALESVIKEQRIRIGRGLITITPVSEAGLVPEEDVKRHSRASRRLLTIFLQRMRIYRRRMKN